LIIFAPKILPREKDGTSRRAELTPTKSSGVLVEKATRRRDTRKVGTLNISDILRTCL